MGEFICNLKFEFKGIEKYSMLNTNEFKNAISAMFVEFRNGLCNIFNDKIESINKAWDDKCEKAGAKNAGIDDPEYVKFIQESLAKDFKEYNDKIFFTKGVMLEYFLDDYCDIRATLRLFPDVEIGAYMINVREEEKRDKVFVC